MLIPQGFMSGGGQGWVVFVIIITVIIVIITIISLLLFLPSFIKVPKYHSAKLLMEISFTTIEWAQPIRLIHNA